MRFSNAVTLSCRSVMSTRYAEGLQSNPLCTCAQDSEYLGTSYCFSDIVSQDSAITRVADVTMTPMAITDAITDI